MTYLRPAWNSKNRAIAKNEEATMGTIQWMVAELVQPNQKREIGRITPLIMAMGSLFSGMKSKRHCQQDEHVGFTHDSLSSPFLNIGFKM